MATIFQVIANLATANAPLDKGIAALNKFRRGGAIIRRAHGNSDTRLIISYDNHRSKVTDLNFNSANGVVVDTATWTVLVRPPTTTIKSNSPYNIVNFMKKYEVEIYPILDGTTVTLYWWDNKWRISTSQAYEVNSYTGFTTTTYEQAVSKIIDILSLDKETTYTIGFHHPDFHPFTPDKSNQVYAWFIQSTKAGVVNKSKPDELTGVLSLSTVAVPPDQSSLDFANWLCGKNQVSLIDWAVNCSNGHYGWIIRKVDRSDASTADIILESLLYSKIRNIIYKGLKAIDQEYDKLTFIVIKAYLNHLHKKNVKILFPEWSHKIKMLDTITDDVIEYTMQYLINGAIVAAKPDVAAEYSEALTSAAQMMSAHISRYERIEGIRRQGPNIVIAYIVVPDNTKMFYNLYTIYNKQT